MSFSWTTLKISIGNPISLIFFYAKIKISTFESLFLEILERVIYWFVLPISLAIPPHPEQKIEKSSALGWVSRNIDKIPIESDVIFDTLIWYVE